MDPVRSAIEDSDVASYDNFAIKNNLPRGIAAPTSAREQGERLYGFPLTSVPEDFQRASGKPFSALEGAPPFSCRGLDAPTTAREWDLAPYEALTLFFRWRKKSVQKKASGTATPEAARPVARYSQISAFRALPCPALVFAQACQSLTAYGSCAHWARAPSRPKLRSAVAERLDDPNLFGSSNSGLRAGTV